MKEVGSARFFFPHVSPTRWPEALEVFGVHRGAAAVQPYAVEWKLE